jgi:hypothetical protein
MALQEKDEWQEIFLASRQSVYKYLVGTSEPIVCWHCLQKQLVRSFWYTEHPRISESRFFAVTFRSSPCAVFRVVSIV